MNYPTLPFALVFELARVTPERASLGDGIRQVGIHIQKDKGITSARVEIKDDQELPLIEGQVARMMTEAEYDTVTLTFSMVEAGGRDVGVILEKGKEPMIFEWQWLPNFGMTLIENEELLNTINDWSGVRLARNLIDK